MKGEGHTAEPAEGREGSDARQKPWPWRVRGQPGIKSRPTFPGLLLHCSKCGFEVRITDLPDRVDESFEVAAHCKGAPMITGPARRAP